MTLSLRDEFNKTIDGAFNEIGIGMPVLLRRMRRDPVTFAKTPCTCVDPLTHEADLDTVCVYCLGDGFYWDEEWITAYKVVVGSETSLARREIHERAGRINTNLARFYLKYDANFLPGDSIIEVVLDVEGNVDPPARRLTKWSPVTVEEKRGDNGRIEYYKITCQATNLVRIDKSSDSYIENP